MGGSLPQPGPHELLISFYWRRVKVSMDEEAFCSLLHFIQTRRCSKLCEDILWRRVSLHETRQNFLHKFELHLFLLMSMAPLRYRSGLIALSVWSAGLGKKPDGWDWGAKAEGSNVTLAWCWQMYPLDQRQEKQQGPLWSTAACCRDLSHCGQGEEVDHNFTFLSSLLYSELKKLYLCLQIRTSDGQ